MGTIRFNSRTREDATFGQSVTDTKAVVSIHAPVRMRRWKFSNLCPFLVSIHAPVRMRPFQRIGSMSSVGFNSRTREDATIR